MPTKPLRIGRLLIFGTLSFLDLALTYHLLQRGGGRVYESNPVANAWLSSYGWIGLALFKLLTMGLVIVVAVVLSARRPRAATSILTFACSAVALVVVYSCSLAGFFGEKVRNVTGQPLIAEHRTASATVGSAPVSPEALQARRAAYLKYFRLSPRLRTQLREGPMIRPASRTGTALGPCLCCRVPLLG